MLDTFNPLERPEDAFLEWLLSTEPEAAGRLLRHALLARHDLHQAGVNPMLVDGLSWFVEAAETHRIPPKADNGDSLPVYGN